MLEEVLLCLMTRQQHRNQHHDSRTQPVTFPSPNSPEISIYLTLHCQVYAHICCVCCTVLPQVAKAGRLHFQQQQGLGFLKDIQLADAEGQQLPQSLRGSAADWIAGSASIELVWLHFAIHRYYHSVK